MCRGFFSTERTKLSVNGLWMETFGGQGLEVGLELWNLAYGNWFYNVYDSGGGSAPEGASLNTVPPPLAPP